MNTINFQDVIVSTSTCYNFIEQFGSFGSRRFEVIQQNSIDITVRKCAFLSPLQELILRVAQIVLFPLTFVSFLFKVCLRKGVIFHLEESNPSTPINTPRTSRTNSLISNPLNDLPLQEFVDEMNMDSEKNENTSRDQTLEDIPQGLNTSSLVYNKSSISSLYRDTPSMKERSAAFIGAFGSMLCTVKPNTDIDILQVISGVFQFVEKSSKTQESIIGQMGRLTIKEQQRFMNQFLKTPLSNYVIKAQVLQDEIQNKPFSLTEESLPSINSALLVFSQEKKIIVSEPNSTDSETDDSFESENGDDQTKIGGESLHHSLLSFMTRTKDDTEDFLSPLEESTRSLMQESFSASNSSWLGSIDDSTGTRRHALQEVTLFLQEKGGVGMFDSAPFTEFLFNLCTKHVFHRTDDSYEKLLTVFRRHTNSEDLDIAYRIMTQPLLVTGAAILSRQLAKLPIEVSFSSQIKQDIKTLKKQPLLEDYEGSLHRATNKARAVMNHFDPLLQGNLPFSVGKKFINGQEILIKRIPCPTIENGVVEISPEYKKYLAYCKKNQYSTLYCSLLNPNKNDEKPRIDKLFALSLDPEYLDTFHFIRFPFDGPLHHPSKFATLKIYKQTIQDSIEEALLEETNLHGNFIFSAKIKKIVEETYRDVLDFAESCIGTNRTNSVDTDNDKKILLLLFCAILKDIILSRLNIFSYNNTCKDGIDRAIAFLVTELLWYSLLNNSLSENYPILRTIVHWPAFMAKTQAILDKRAAWMLTFSDWIETKVDNHKELAASYENQFGIKITKNLQFDLRDTLVSEKNKTITRNMNRYKGQPLQSIKVPMKIDPYDIAKDHVQKQFAADKNRLNLNMSKLFGSNPNLHNTPHSILHVLFQLLSQTALSLVLKTQQERYPFPIHSPREKYETFITHPNHVLGKWIVGHKNIHFIICDVENGRTIGHLVTSVEFSFKGEDATNLDNLKKAWNVFATIQTEVKDINSLEDSFILIENKNLLENSKI